MQVLHVCSEIFPLLKTGGLADVVGALPAAQIAEGIDTRVLLPGFPDLKRGRGKAANVRGLRGAALWAV
jgi:starch synthase